MKSDDDIFLGLVSIEQSDCVPLQDGFIAYFEICQKLHESGQAYEKANNELQSAIAGKNSAGIKNAVRSLRFSAREHGLLMNQASKAMSGLSARCLSLSEKLAATISTEGSNTP